MFKVIVTEALISKGYGTDPAFKFTDSKTAVNFKIGYRVYDKKAEGSHRFINIAVKAFGSVCERIEKMQLKEGYRVNIAGRFDEDQWDDKETGEKCSRYVIIAEEIEYASNDGGKSNGNGNGADKTNAGTAPPVQNGQGQAAAPPNAPAAPVQPQEEKTGMPPSFNGYQNIDGENPFY